MSSKKPSSVAMSLADLDSKFNPNVIIPKRINAALEKLGDNAMTAADFAKFAVVSVTQLAAYEEQFTDYLISVRDGSKAKTLWAGTKAFAQKARERLPA